MQRGRNDAISFESKSSGGARFFVVVVTVVAVFAQSASFASSTGLINGTVVDSTGAFIPCADAPFHDAFQ
jgi:hypothetical protein